MLTVLEYILLAVLITLNLVISRWIGQQAYSWMPVQATAEAQKVDDLFSFLVAVGAFVFLGIASVIIYSLLFFRAPPDDYSEGHPGRGNWKVEVLWTGAPLVLVLWIAFQSFNIYEQIDILGLTPIVHLHNPLEEPAYAQDNAQDYPQVYAQNYSQNDTRNHSQDNFQNSSQNNSMKYTQDYAQTTDNSSKPAATEIQVIAKQWEWSFRYPNQVTSQDLHLPVNESIRLVMQSEDVIHGFYIPAFRVKQDIIPARTITFVITPTRVGQYRLQDSQFSGTNFALMTTPVMVESRAAYQQWLDAIAQAPSLSPQTLAKQLPSRKPLFNSGWETPSPT